MARDDENCRYSVLDMTDIRCRDGLRSLSRFSESPLPALGVER